MEDTIITCRHCSRIVRSRSGRCLCRPCWDNKPIRKKYPIVAEFSGKRASALGVAARRARKENMNGHANGQAETYPGQREAEAIDDAVTADLDRIILESGIDGGGDDGYVNIGIVKVPRIDTRKIRSTSEPSVRRDVEIP